MAHPKQHATRILVLMEAYVKKQVSIRIMTAFVLILDLKEGSVMWTCVLNVIRTLDASTENAFAAKVIKEMASPVRKVSVEMMAGDQSLSFCTGPFEK